MNKVVLTNRAKESGMVVELETLSRVLEDSLSKVLNELEDMRISINVSRKWKNLQVVIHYKDGGLIETVSIVEKSIKSCGLHPVEISRKQTGKVIVEFEK